MRYRDAGIIIGGGNGIFGLSDWVMLLKLIVFLPGFGDGGEAMSECSLVGCEFESEETNESPESDSESDGLGDGGSARCRSVAVWW